MSKEFESAVSDAVLGNTYSVDLSFAEMTLVVKALRGTYEPLVAKTAAIMDNVMLNEAQKEDGLAFLRQAFTITRDLDNKLMDKLAMIDKDVIQAIKAMPEFAYHKEQLTPVVAEIVKKD